MWYTIDGGVSNLSISTNSTIDSILWEQIPFNTLVTIRFYANDSTGNLSFSEIEIWKKISPNTPNSEDNTDNDENEEVPENNMMNLWEILAIIGAAATMFIAASHFRSNKKKDSNSKSSEDNELDSPGFINFESMSYMEEINQFTKLGNLIQASESIHIKNMAKILKIKKDKLLDTMISAQVLKGLFTLDKDYVKIPQDKKDLFIRRLQTVFENRPV